MRLYIYIYIFIYFIFIGCESKSMSKKLLQGSSEYKGKDIFERMACNACHSIDGSLKLGPTMHAQYGMNIRHTDGSISKIDDDYIRESIIYPLKYIVEGYTPIMPSYQPILSDEDIENIIAYIRSIK